MKPLTVEHVIRLQSQLIEATGGLGGVKDKGLISSSLATVFFNLFWC